MLTRAYSAAPDNTDDFKKGVNSMIAKGIRQTNNAIDQLVGAVFGNQGQSQDVIPDSMRVGGDYSECRVSLILKTLLTVTTSRPLHPGIRLGILAQG
jgi:hypothetical protein